MSLFIRLDGQERFTSHVIGKYIERLIAQKFFLVVTTNAKHTFPKDIEDCDIEIDISIPEEFLGTHYDRILNFLKEEMPFICYAGDEYRMGNTLDISFSSYKAKDFILQNASLHI